MRSVRIAGGTAPTSAVPDLGTLSLPILALLFTLSAALVWFAGTKLAGYADEIAERTGMGQATTGVLLLGAITSLPEISTSVSATLTGNSAMAVNNLVGSASFQLVVLAVCDLFVGRGALTSMIPGPRTILNAAVSIVLLVLFAVGVMVGDWPLPVLGIGLFPLMIALTYVVCTWQLSRSAAVAGWVPAEKHALAEPEPQRRSLPKGALALLTTAAGAAICAAGTLATLSAEAIAGATGTSTGIIGLTLMAGATSLPEFSTAIAAVRMRKAELAIGNVLGGNMFNTGLIVLVDLLDWGEPVLRQVDRNSTTAALIAVLLTTLFLIGLIERRDKAVLRMGYDSIAVMVVYVAGMAAIVGGLASG